MKLTSLKPFSAVIIVAIIATLVMLFSDLLREVLRYQSTEVSQGEYWRIMTANLVHSNWNHWLLNFCGLVLIDYLFQPFIKQSLRISLLIFCMLINVWLLHIFANIGWYVGLSGALHGFLVGGAILSWKSAKLINSLILAVVWGKLFVELNWEINSTTANLIGANVIEEAHLFGAISALIFCILFWVNSNAIRIIKTKKAH